MLGTFTADKLINYNLPTTTEVEVFDLGCFENVGKAMCLSLLDFSNKNPKSRLPNTPFKRLSVNPTLLIIFLIFSQ